MARDGGRGSLPAGTVTFLFSDVERSTQTAAELGDERYADLQDEHRAILREAFGTHGGSEVATEGDACFIAFASASQAVAAAAEAQHAMLDRSPLRVRIGLHTGEALVRGNDYVGHEVHRAKRISDAGHGGQILVSKTTADLVASTAVLKDLGSHRLKDLGEPQRIYQLVADGLEQDFGPLRSIDVFRHNLPPQRTPFIGREAAIARVMDLLSTSRLVTLTGVGGAGKTRLAIQVGASSVEVFTDGVFFCDLAPVTDAALVPSRVAASVGGELREIQATAQAEQSLVDMLASKNALVILDNCEHLIEACANLADRILESCPQVRLLATSREALDIDGEHVYAVRSLDLPTEGDAAASESVRLFVERARAVRDDFELDEDSLSAVAEICERLDGIPLALELAAAQIAHLSPDKIAEQLGDRFALLTGGRKRVQRQQTLAAAVDWSYDLLTDVERDVLCRLAVFPSTFRCTRSRRSAGTSTSPS